MTGLARSARIYIGLLTVGAVAALAVAFRVSGEAEQRTIWLALALGAGVTLAWLFPIPLPPEREYYVDAAPSFAALLLLPAPWAMLAVGGGTLAAHALRRASRDLAQALFNTAQIVLCVGLGSVVLIQGGWNPAMAGVDGPRDLAVLLAAGCAIFLANGATLATMIGLHTGRNPLRAWIEAIGRGSRGALLVYAMLLDLGLVAAILTSHRAWQLVLVALPVVVGVQLLRWQTQARLRAETALRLANLGTWTWDLITGARTWSSDARRILGVEGDPASGDPLSGLVHAGDRERLDAALAEWAAGRARRGASVDVRIVRPDGAERVIAIQGEVEREAGRPARVIGTILDITERTWREADLVRRASLDPLTGLPNRAFLLERLTQALARDKGDEAGIAVLFLDLDGFKQVNDTFGHAAGDELLAEVARTIQAELRPGDTGARFGGDEFVILLDPVLDPQDALAHASILVRRLRRSYMVGERTDAAAIAASIGVAWTVPGQTTADALLRGADLALRHAKASGKDRAILDPAGEPARELRTVDMLRAGGEVAPQPTH